MWNLSCVQTLIVGDEPITARRSLRQAEVGSRRNRKMLDPMLLHLHQAKQSAQWFAQLIQLDPELVAALPLVAARLMDAGGVDDDLDDDLLQADLAVS